MSAVNVLSVSVLDNPTGFRNPLQFEIQYECTQPIRDDLEWKLIYVGSAESEKYDQQLEDVLVGPVTPGQYRFILQANAPDPARLPQDDIVGVTVLLLTCSYRQQEFIRIGYYVNNDYVDEELRENHPQPAKIDKLQRIILADKPRVTKFPVHFDDSPPAAMDEGAVPTAEDLSTMGAAQAAAAAVALQHQGDDQEMDMQDEEMQGDE